jgi:apolipoprotein N-acyltransferase
MQMLKGCLAQIGSVLAGTAVGAGFGSPLGWLVAQCALVFVLAQLIEVDSSSARASRLAALFSFALYAVGYLGFAAGVAEPVRWFSLVPLSVLIAAHVICVTAAAWVVCRWRVPSFLRWALVWPSLWLLIEWLFSLGDLGMPWLRLGQLQAPMGPFASALPVGGTLLAGACMWALAAAIAVAWRLRHRAALPVALILICVGAAAAQLCWTDQAGTLNATLVQPGLTSNQRHDDAAVQELLHRYANAAAGARAAVVVTPQLALPKTTAALPEGYLEDLAKQAGHRQADLLLGLYAEAPAGGVYNSVLVLGASGAQRYLKHQLFPFGEFVPLRDWIGRWVDAGMGVALQDTMRGPRDAEPLYVAGRRAALAICFEAAFGDAWRAQAAAAELLIHVSSDGSIASGQMSRQALQVAQARALEFQKPLLRSSDVNGSYAIDHRGRVIGALPPDVSSELDVTIEPRAGMTPFARFGDALALTLSALALCAAGLLYLRGRRAERRAPALPAARLHSQSGQVILPALGLLLVTAALFYFMVNSGQAVNEKTRVVNAADAAAYSAGIVEARALNYQAYMNRAMVANEIIIAQLVSLASWTWYFANAVDYVGESVTEQVFMLAPDVRAGRLTAIFAATKYVLEYYTQRSASDYAKYIVDYGIGPSVWAHDLAVTALSASQHAVQLNLIAGLRQRQIAHDVVTAMDPKLDAQVVLVSHGFDSFTKSYARNGSGGDERGRFADVTMRSRDAFTRERNWTIKGDPIQAWRKNGAMKKRGGTDLVGYDEWRAVDTLELHGQHFFCGSFRNKWCDDIRTPVGWGAVNVNAGGGDEGAGHHGNAYDENPTTADRADADMKEPGIYKFSGLPDSRDVADVDADAPWQTGITILVSKKHTDTLTSGGAAQAKPSGELALFNDRPAKGRMAALSRASVFFDRISPRADGKAEIASLYNPFWRVRLVAPVAADRAYAAAQQGGLALPLP